MKKCAICSEALKDGDLVVALLMARFRPKEASYDLEVMAQTVASHVYCTEAVKPIDSSVKPA